MRSWVSESPAETLAIGSELARALVPHGVLLLFGDLGSGKTVLARGVARALGISEQDIQSPTYTLIHEHERSGRRLVHVDLYRLEMADVAAIGLEETLAGVGVKVVEWADRLPFAVAGAVGLRIVVGPSGTRTINEIEIE